MNASSSNSGDCHGVKLYCTFMDTANDTDQCVGFILKRSHMTSNLGLLNITVYEFTKRSSDSATVTACLQGFNILDIIVYVFLFNDDKIIGVPATISRITGIIQNIINAM